MTGTPWKNRFLLGLTAGFLLLATLRAAADGDGQFWLDLDAGGSMNEYVSGRFKQSLRWREDVDGLNSYFLDGNLTLQALQWLNLRGAYRHIWAKESGRDGWLEEQRPYADAVVRLGWGPASLSDRNRFEWREVQGKEGEFRYRNKLTVLRRKGFTRYEYRPYVAGEVFLNEGNTDQLDRNRYRLTVGIRGDPEDQISHVVKLPPANAFKGDLFFSYESTKTEDAWVDSYILGMKLGAFF